MECRADKNSCSFVATSNDEYSSNLSSSKSDERQPALDGLRGFAAMSVAIWHGYVMILDTSDPLAKSIHTFGFTARSGVDLFFVLSGFLIARRLLRKRDSKDYWREFYIRRVFRILPLYLLLLAILTFAQLNGLHARILDGPIPAGYYWVFLQNHVAPYLLSTGAPILAASWSLAVEEQFYLLLPPIIRKASIRSSLWIFFVIAGVTTCIRWYLLTKGGFGTFASYVWGICRFDALLIGAIIAHIELTRPRLLATIYAVTRRWCVGIALLIPCSGILLAANIDLGMARWGYSVYAVIYGVILINALQRTSFLARILNWRAFVFFGRISYGYYLLQWPVLILTWQIAGRDMAIRHLSDVLIASCGLAVTGVISWLSFRFYESPLIAMGRSISH